MGLRVKFDVFSKDGIGDTDKKKHLWKTNKKIENYGVKFFTVLVGSVAFRNFDFATELGNVMESKLKEMNHESFGVLGC